MRAGIEIMADDHMHASTARGDRVLPRGSDIYAGQFFGHGGADHEVRKLNGGWPTRCQSSVSMWQEGAGGFPGDVNAGNVLNRMFREPAPPVTRSNSLIIEERRAAFVVTIGT